LLGSLEIVQALAHQLEEGKRTGNFIVVLAPVVQIPTELEKQFVVIEHQLPDRNQLREIAHNLAADASELPPEDRMEMLLDASVGLTRLQAEGAYGLSLVRHGRIDPETVWDLKAQELNKSGLLRLHRGDESFADL